MSLPAWEGWIEIDTEVQTKDIAVSLPAWEGWIEMLGSSVDSQASGRPFPHGKGGLKYEYS